MKILEIVFMSLFALCIAPVVHAHHEEHVASAGLHTLHHVLIGLGIAALVAGLVWLYRSKQRRRLSDDN